MGLFTKEISCENCGNVLLKKQACDYYDSWKGNPKAKSQKLCSQCALDKFSRSLMQAHAKAVFIQPCAKSNAIHYFELNKINSLDDNEEFSACMRNACPKDGQPCDRCGTEAFYTWCSLEILSNDILNWEPFSDDYERQYLCKECLVEALKKQLEDENIQLTAIFPAYGEEGFYLQPW